MTDTDKRFNRIAEKLAPWSFRVALFLLCIGVFWGLFIAPADYQQKDAFRIIYIHVPAASMSMMIYVAMALAAIIYYVWEVKLAADFCRSVAVLGATFTALALFTGSVWGKPMWGTYWTWDPRLVSELILLFLYVGYLALISAIEQETLGNKIGSIVLVVGVINIPIIHFSVKWWNSIHQGSTMFKAGKPAMDPHMLYPLLLCIFGYLMFTLGYALMATRAKQIEDKNQLALLEAVDA